VATLGISYSRTIRQWHQPRTIPSVLGCGGERTATAAHRSCAMRETRIHFGGLNPRRPSKLYLIVAFFNWTIRKELFQVGPFLGRGVARLG
jgi:hypothetical protein